MLYRLIATSLLLRTIQAIFGIAWASHILYLPPAKGKLLAKLVHPLESWAEKTRRWQHAHHLKNSVIK